MTKLLKDKIAIITGAGRGIGAATAKRLAAEGAYVVMTYSRSKDAAEAVLKEIQDAGGAGEALSCNAAEAGATGRMVEDVATRHAGVDILINNAGVYPQTTLGKCTDAQWAETLAVNMTAPFEAIRACYHHMKPGGAIVTVGSILGESSPTPGLGAYCASKGGVQLLTRAAARELGRKHIRANIIQPGPIDTDMNPADGETADLQRMMVALGRYGRADEVADLALFLASDQSSYLTGAVINIDGGLRA